MSKIVKQYNNDYFNVHMVGGYEAQKDNPTFRKRVEEFSRLGYSRGTVLDLGCAYGYFMKECQKAGYKTIGVDVSKKASSKAKKLTSAQVYSLELGSQNLPLSSRSVDIISMFNTLEHIWNYPQVLFESRRVLKPNGMLYIYIPTEPRWLTDKTHVNYFTLSTLQYVLDIFGFDILTMGEEGGRYRNLCGIIRYIVNRNTYFNYVPKGTGAFISCFARKR